MLTREPPFDCVTQEASQLSNTISQMEQQLKVRSAVTVLDVEAVMDDLREDQMDEMQEDTSGASFMPSDSVAPIPANPNAWQSGSAHEINERVQSIQKREAFLQEKINAELARAQECSEKKDERGEMMALKKKKLNEEVRDPRAFS